MRLPTILLVSLAAACATTAGDEPPGDADAVGEALDDAGSAEETPGPDDGETPACRVDLDCNDRIACTVDRCREGRCVHLPCTDCCRDDLVCIPGRGCDAPPRPCAADGDCRDGVPCTIDRCGDDAVCEHIPHDELCGPNEFCLAGPGCLPRPPDRCSEDADCVVGPACVGEWRCVFEFGCQFVGILDCDDRDGCTVDRCDDAVGCVNLPRDIDGDTHVDAACGGDDCDDGDRSRRPSAEERCNGVDDDCDTLVDETCCEEGAACDTTCRTAGSRTCNPDGTQGPCAPPVESCNGVDDDCDGTTDEVFDCARGSTTACNTDCDTAGTSTCDPACAWGPCTPPVEACNGVDDDCDGERDEDFACALGTSFPCTTSCRSVGSRACLPGCTLDAICVPPPEICNGVDDDCNGACDEAFACCAGRTADCSTLGWHAGTARCADDCSGWSTSGCTNCGNLRRDAGEECDGGALDGQDCVSIGRGFGGGTLRCAANCTFDVSGCTRCGNGTIDPGEQCDGSALGGNDCTTIGGGFAGGSLGCTPACAFDTSQCTRPFDPSGVYVVTPAPTYSCAFGLVNFSISSLTFSDSGTVLSVVGAPCPFPSPMTGPSARTTRTINVSCLYPGSCNETYSLTGSFVTDDGWTGTFRAGYSGSCFDCTTRSWSVSGQR
ncbi:MAG: MopE-related protein [Myxococcota bacterium]|nr:MopE-related protein [Myxococcota bacterium]